MYIRAVSTADYSSIVAIHNSLNIVWPAWPTDANTWTEIDKNRDPKCDFQRFIAEEADKIVGMASCGHRLDDYDPQKFYINLEVPEEYRRRGIGTALYDQVISAMQPYSPRILRADVLQNQSQSYPFLEKRGFKEVWRETPVHLDVADFDFSRYEALEAGLAASGIRICSLNELKDDPLRDRKVYELYMALGRDVPSELSEFIQSPFEDWSKWCLNDPSTDFDAFFIAVDGGQYIAMHDLSIDSEHHSLLGGLLGTLPAYRNRHIGLTLVVRAIRTAREQHLALFRTCTAIVNQPMQALFSQLGFSRDPEWQQCQKDIPA